MTKRKGYCFECGKTVKIGEYPDIGAFCKSCGSTDALNHARKLYAHPRRKG